MIHALRHSADSGRRFHVEFDGDFIVVASRDPEPDAARALLARGYRGRITMVDSKTGTARLSFDIEKLAGLCVKEGPLRFAPYESRPERPPAGETAPGRCPGA